jgi:hypothetical protein
LLQCPGPNRFLTTNVFDDTSSGNDATPIMALIRKQVFAM